MKASGPYTSLVQGVSQQAPEIRGPGRMTEQVNMIPDPVYGVTRRQGTKYKADYNLGISSALEAACAEDISTWRTLSYNNGIVDIDLAYRTTDKPVGSTLPPVLAFDRTNNVFLNYQRGVDSILDQLEAGGVSAITAVGRYVFAAGNDIVPTATSTALWAATSNARQTAVWIRGGAYSRTFSVTVTHTSLGDVTVTYTTPESSYPGTLDTSLVPQFMLTQPAATNTDTEIVFVKKVSVTEPWPGGAATAWRCDLAWGQWDPSVTTVEQSLRTAGLIVATTLTNSYPAAPTAAQYYWAPADRYVYFNATTWATALAADSTLQNIWNTVEYVHATVDANPNYTRAVTDLTSEYNAAVTQWIGTAAAAIQPEAIALQIHDAFTVAGVTNTLVGSHIIFDNVTAVTVSDAGDGTLIRGVANTITGITDVTDIHYPGKVVKVQAKNSAESFYLKAVGTGVSPTHVTWVEGQATVHTVTSALVYLYANGSTLWAASSATLLNALIPASHPAWEASVVGDPDSQPVPAFIGNTISYLGVFQDRLLIGSKGTLHLSRTGDYLNPFRSTVLTIPASDAFSMRAEGPEDDTLRFSALYNKDLILFGRKRQYVVQGRVPITPTSANMPVMSSHADAADVPPIEVGGLVFYASANGNSSTVFQMEPTVNLDSPASFPASSQLDDYIVGSIVEFANSTRPMALYCRTDSSPNTVYTFQYVDTNQGRKQDAWYKWEFNAALGSIAGIANKNNKMLLYFLRVDGGQLWWVADEVSLSGSLASTPYLDSQRLYSVLGSGGHTLQTIPASPWGVAYDNQSAYFLQGRADATAAAALSTSFPSAPAASRWVGCEYPAYIIPTNPVMKDKSDVAITTGELTVGALGLVVTNSSGVAYTIADRNVTEEYTLNGRVLGDTLVGRVPITTGKYTIPVFKGSTEYRLTLAANTWLPLTISSMDWVGQFFNRTARLG